MANATGIDISSHNTITDWNAIRASGLDFIVAKFTQGTGYRWSGARNAWAAAQEHGLECMPYHFLEWGVDPIAQADYFLNTNPDLRGKRRVAIDVEKPGDAGRSVYEKMPFGPKQAVSMLRTCVDHVTEQTGHKPLLYTYRDAWLVTVGNSDAFGDCPLWIADYDGTPTPLPGWRDWAVWQTSVKGSIPGAAYPVDMDTFNGTIEQMRVWLGVQEPEPQTQDPMYFPQTGQYLSHGFLKFWKEHQYLGFPLSGEFEYMLENSGVYIVQLFERGLLHWRMGDSVGEARIGAMWGKAAGLIP